MKKILLVDDSALMRRVLCDIIESDNRFQVVDRATNGIEAFDLLSRNTYDAVVLDVNMPKMNGLELLKKLQQYKISARVLMASTDTREGAKTTIDALELGAIDFIHKPDNAVECRTQDFKERLLATLEVVVDANPPTFQTKERQQLELATTQKIVDIVKRNQPSRTGKKIVAIASSTGGPSALRSVIEKLPANLNAPVLIVQHMPAGFTASLADRLNDLSAINVKEAEDNEILQSGHVYIAKGGSHMKVRTGSDGRVYITFSDEPTREGVRPCANYMYESLSTTKYDEILCVVMTGMGADGTKGIQFLKEQKKVHVIAQNQETCAVYGMPKSIVGAGLADQVEPLELIAQEIILNVGVM